MTIIRIRQALSQIVIAVGCMLPIACAVSQEPATITETRLSEIQPVGEFPRRPTPTYSRIQIDKSIPVAMRDGVRLSTDVYTPSGVHSPLPVIMIRLPYGKHSYLGLRAPGSDAHFFAGHGYRVVVQDMRGRFESEGDYRILADDGNDGYDTISWIVNQEWSNGHVGTYGCSYLGENQIVLATERHPNHLAAIPQGAGGGYIGTGRPFMSMDGGVAELASSLGWFLEKGAKFHLAKPPGMSDSEFRANAHLYSFGPKKTDRDLSAAFWYLPIESIVDRIDGPASDFSDFVSRGPGDPYWKQMNLAGPDDQFEVAALHVNSWYDGAVNETLALFNLFRENGANERARNNQFVIISPTGHCMSERRADWEDATIGDRPVGDIRKDYFRIYLDWFDHWLKGEENGVTDMPRVQMYATGTNKWLNADAWPLEGAEYKHFYLRSNGQANTRDGDGRLSLTLPSKSDRPDQFSYDPADPVPTRGGAICCISDDAAAAGGYDQTSVEQRDDVLVYTSDALVHDVTVAGPITITLFVSSSARDTDFTAKLVDVAEDGSTFNIQDGILRARYRQGYDKQLPMEEGEVYELTLDLHATANVFRAGHRIRLQISSSNFPRFARNLNTGGANHDETEWVVARNVIHHSTTHPSKLTLPIIETGE